MPWIRRAALAAVLTLSAGCGDDSDPGADATTTTAGPAATVTTVAQGESTEPAPGPGPGETTATTEVHDEAFYAGCRAQVAAVREGFGESDFGETTDVLVAWEESGCAAECGPIGTPTNPRCIEA